MQQWQMESSKRMTQQANAVIEETAAQTPAPANPVDLNLQQLPGITQPTEAELAAAEAKAEAEQKAKEANAVARFDTTIGFKLEGELVGATKRKVSKAGAVKVTMGSKKEMGLASGGMKGSALEDFTRLHSDKLKEKQSMLAMRLATDNQWTGSAYVLSAKGDKITLEYRKAPAMKVTETPEPTDEMIAKVLGKSVEQVKQMKIEAKQEAEAKAKAEQVIRERIEAEAKKQMEADRAKAKNVRFEGMTIAQMKASLAQMEADEQAAKELAEEAAQIAKSAQSNGAVGHTEDEGKSDNDTE